MPITIAPAEKKHDDVERDSKGRFLTGHKAAGPGRPKGSKHKLGEQLLSELQKDFEQHGAKAIVEMRQEKPAEYIKALVSLLPKDVNLNVNKFEDMDDDQLLARIRQLDAAVVPALAAHGIAAGAGGTDGRAGDETTH